MVVLQKVEHSDCRPSKVDAMLRISSRAEGYTLLDDQLIVYDKLLAWQNKDSTIAKNPS